MAAVVADLGPHRGARYPDPRLNYLLESPWALRQRPRGEERGLRDPSYAGGAGRMGRQSLERVSYEAIWGAGCEAPNSPSPGSGQLPGLGNQTVSTRSRSRTWRTAARVAIRCERRES